MSQNILKPFSVFDQDTNFPFLAFCFCFLVCPFLYLSYTMQHAGSLFSNGDETCMDPVLCAGEGQNPSHWSTREVPDSDKFE